MAPRSATLLLAAAAPCAAHFSLNKPASWLDTAGKFQWYGGQTTAGCTGKSAPGESETAQGCVYEWYSNYTFIPGEPTIPPLSPLLTYKDACMGRQDDSTPHSEACCNAPCNTVAGQGKGGACVGCDWTRKMPWRAPGSAPVFSPCGFDGGNPKGCPVGNPNGDKCAGGGYGHGTDGRSLGKKGNTHPDVWTAGGEAEVAWGITANHGGGYQYRLCPKPVDTMDLTEECFQKLPLRFVGSTQWLQKTTDTSSRVAISAMRTSTGTVPTGSQWTRNPIPACGGFGGGSVPGGVGCVGTQFAPPAAGASGFFRIPASVVDKVEVPNVAPGDYVIQLRFDCEQTSQVWQQCGDVRIVGSGPSPPAPAPQPAGTLYGCVASTCVPVTSGGVPDLKTCQKVCKGHA